MTEIRANLGHMLSFFMLEYLIHIWKGGGGKRQGSSCILFGSIVVACREQTRGHLNCTRDLGADYGDRVYHMYIVGVIYFM